ncbi:GNAT family N-acetyltransferase [Corynebacterium otitidis]|uniref:GNAT family N-acetyltransferase n=1 Tax=Corynebacterium otitidis TaxID=29321 RepID=UPI000627A692|nr:GNAT family N-acetyltransferase [Corynebacterium otitidis]KKO84011.1 hypothetical protein AAV33_03505 [Corynebacterium otitidis]
MSTPRLRRLRPGDAAAAAALDREIFPLEGPWDEDEYADALRDPACTFLGADAPGGGLAAAGGMLLVEPAARLLTVGVAPGHQGVGLGGRLVDALLGLADGANLPVALEVRAGNEAAIALYERRGFRAAGLLKGYYQPGDALAMMRPRKAAGRAGR